MRKAQKAAVMAFFASRQAALEEEKAQAKSSPFEPKSGEPIIVDPLWLIHRGPKGRA